MRGPVGRLAALASAMLVVAGCASRPAPAPNASPAAPQQPAKPASAAAREEASDHFYRGKALALAGDNDCAQVEFRAALEGFRLASRPSDADDLAFASDLYDSVALYHPFTPAPGAEAENERPPAEDPRDSLVATPAAAAPEEVEAAKREVAAARPKLSFDIPVVVNEQVLKAVAFYQFRTPQAFAGALKRSGRYLPLMRSILKEQGLPQDLVFVAMVESAFKHQAHSRAAAHGFWQFIGGTGKRYGLRKTRAFDERSDPVKSTVAAARYFRDLYEMFGDWHLAMAGYDAGEGKILKGLQRTGARDYWELSAGSHLHRETRDYVPFVLAAALISKDPARYGFDVVPDPPLQFDVVRIARPIDLGRLASTIGVRYEDLQLLNSELKGRSTPHGVAEYALRVPAGRAALVSQRVASLPTAPDVAERKIVVKKADTLKRIAARHRVPLADLCDWNDLPRTARVKRGTVLVIPARGAVRPSATAARSASQPQPAESPAVAGVPEGEIRSLPTPSSAVTRSSDIAPFVTTMSVNPPSAAGGQALPAGAAPQSDRVEIPAAGFDDGPARAAASRPRVEAATAAARTVRYVVRRGDTLYRIATKFGVSVEAIRRQNRMAARQTIRAGQRLTLTLAIAN